MAASNDVKKLYLQVVQDVCTAVREALSEEGFDDQTISELRSQWTNKLDNARALEPLPVSATDEATTRMNRRTTTNDHHHAGGVFNKAQVATATSTNIRPVITNASYGNPGLLNTNTVTIPTAMGNTIGPGATATLIRPMGYTLPQGQPTMPNNSVRTSNQLDGANDEMTTEQKKNVKRSNRKQKIEVSFQVDGTGPPLTDDEDEDDDNDIEGNEPVDDLDEDDDDDDGNEDGKEDSRPLCSEDDVSDDEPAELFETDNVVVCQYEKITRTKNKWRFTLKSGVMIINGRDYIFSKATGDADW